METTLASVDAEVQRLANEMTPELLPRLFKRLLQRDSLVTCERHDSLLLPYVRAQITLTWARRRHHQDWNPPCSHSIAGMGPSTEQIYVSALARRDSARQAYRSTPCTCWVRHR